MRASRALMTLDYESLKGIAARYAARVTSQNRADPREALPSVRVAYLSRTLAHQKANALVAEADGSMPASTQAETLESLSRERILGKSDLVDVNYLELAIAVSRGVAKVRLPDGSGTGFLVGPGMLMTNHHVLDTPSLAKRSHAHFDYQENAGGQPLPVQVFAFEPERFFFTDRELDFTVVAVAPRSATGRAVTSYPWVKLIQTLGKAAEGDPVNIVQHPSGAMKQIAFRNSEVLAIPPGKADFIYYSTDTEPGSSGSPCFNDQWELIALHHSGVPRTDQLGVPLKKDHTPFIKGHDSEDAIDWIANEGARVSAIFDALKRANFDASQAVARDAILGSTAPNPVELARASAHEGSSNRRVVASRGRSSDGASKLEIVVELSGELIESVWIGRPEPVATSDATRGEDTEGRVDTEAFP